MGNKKPVRRSGPVFAKPHSDPIETSLALPPEFFAGVDLPEPCARCQSAIVYASLDALEDVVSRVARCMPATDSATRAQNNVDYGSHRNFLRAK